ncbi:hypothetical protein SADUNF_Sadunf16G0276000 [Salix dunnii]|uniref:Uncharacterized protein n=1 Tax=Salix dunnii TaxID=1413687 RepID=A0A835MHP8_9ROSI|nr:hypothetical protein SADUNF_Sadunf16G0276000 [Salix dunnii]
MHGSIKARGEQTYNNRFDALKGNQQVITDDSDALNATGFISITRKGLNTLNIRDHEYDPCTYSYRSPPPLTALVHQNL